MTHQAASVLQPRNLGTINWLGLYTLTRKETVRFVKVSTQTVIAPVITTLLFYAVFALALGAGARAVHGIPFLEFLPPGLVMMSMAQNAFANTSSSLVISKVQGNIVDILMAPISPFEFTLGYTLGGIARGLAVGVVSILCLSAIGEIAILHPFYIVYHAVMGSMMMALLGVIGGVWSEKFDHMATVQNFIIMPATFLSGTFYTADRLPPAWQVFCHLNPFFYMIDGFRYGFIGISDGTLEIGVVTIAITNIILMYVAYKLIAAGYKLKF